MKIFFVPKLFTVLKQGYSIKQFRRDFLAGVTVGIVALPLALAFTIASVFPLKKKYILLSYEFKETMKVIEEHPKILILRMRYVPFIDATEVRILREVLKYFLEMNTKVILSGVQPALYEDLEKARIVFLVGKKNICPDIRVALQRANENLEPNELK